MRGCAIGMKCALVMAIVAMVTLSEQGGTAQTRPDPNAAPNPYRVDEGWAKLAQGRKWGAAVGVDIDRDGNVWVSDGRAKNGKGHTVLKFSPDGKLLMTLGKPGVAGDGPDTFNGPSDILVAPSGNIFVADGHGGDTNARIVKLSSDGTFLKAWGKKGTGPGEFDSPHGLALDSNGRLFVADRSNSRIQIFNQDGKFLSEWKQFGRPSGIFIRNNVMYVADSQSDEKTNPGFKQGIRIGSTNDGIVTAFIPWTETNTLEGVAADVDGSIYGGFTNTLNFRRFVRK